MLRDDRFVRDLPRPCRLCVQLRGHQQVLLLPRLPGSSGHECLSILTVQGASILPCSCLLLFQQPTRRAASFGSP